MVPRGYRLTPEESDLVSDAQQGNLAAFNQLVEQHQSVVYNVCLRMLGRSQPAEDAAQETFFAAYRGIKGFRGGAFRGWLLRIASNQCYDALRRRKSHPTEALGEEPLVADPTPQPEDIALGRETLLAIERAMAELPPDQRLCVLLIDVQGLDYDEAAQAMSVNLGTVKSRLSRARARLRELLGPSLRLENGG